MSDSARFALHRPELYNTLIGGERKINSLMGASAREYAPGHVLIEADTEHLFVYRLVRGWACRTRGLPDGRDQCILTFLPGDLFAVKSMFIARHPDRVQILSRSLVERVNHRELHEAFCSDPEVSNRCMWQVVEEERRLHNWVVGLGQGNAEERLAMLLTDFRGRLAISGSIEPDQLTFAMPLTQMQLADHVGITAIHVNRVLRGLRQNGIVVAKDGNVRILDLAKLAQIAYPLLDPYERNTAAYVGTVEAHRTASDTRAGTAPVGAAVDV